jgi:hypothetical protein
MIHWFGLVCDRSRNQKLRNTRSRSVTVCQGLPLFLVDAAFVLALSWTKTKQNLLLRHSFSIPLSDDDFSILLDCIIIRYTVDFENTTNCTQLPTIYLIFNTKLSVLRFSQTQPISSFILIRSTIQSVKMYMTIKFGQ